eukprot:5389763-Prymnesium_polylepis.1
MLLYNSVPAAFYRPHVAFNQTSDTKRNETSPLSETSRFDGQSRVTFLSLGEFTNISFTFGLKPAANDDDGRPSDVSYIPWR